MLERLVAWVLNSYIGEYFGNVNIDQLSVALQKGNFHFDSCFDFKSHFLSCLSLAFTGEVELGGLPLKPNALKHWGLPINVKAGNDFLKDVKVF